MPGGMVAASAMDPGASAVHPACCGSFALFSFRCFSCCPSVKESKSTKCIYSAILVLATALMSAMTVPTIQQHLQAIFRDFNATCIDLKIGHSCMKLTG